MCQRIDTFFQIMSNNHGLLGFQRWRVELELACIRYNANDADVNFVSMIM